MHLQQGLAPLTDVVRGDFTNMPFKENTFDGAYAIEATCHAPKVIEVVTQGSSMALGPRPSIWVGCAPNQQKLFGRSLGRAQAVVSCHDQHYRWERLAALAVQRRGEAGAAAGMPCTSSAPCPLLCLSRRALEST